MNLHHILAAADESEAGHQAVRSAIDLAARARAGVTVMRAVPVGAMAVAAGATEASDFAGVGMERPSIQDLHQWIRTELHAQREPPHVEVGIAAGVPGYRDLPVGGAAASRPAGARAEAALATGPAAPGRHRGRRGPAEHGSRVSSCRPTAARSVKCWWRSTAPSAACSFFEVPSVSPWAPGRVSG